MNAQYGYPRTYQVDQTVGHHDSLQHPSHFIFENLHGRVVIIELPAGEVRNARIYEGPPIVSSEDSTKIPVTGEFLDLNADGKLDMEVHIQGLTIVYINDGTQFVLQK
ncbi:MAG TPA: hypothetical protein VFN35_28670 [Ktedonobacteraceae bacterium]|nr:hypothetical protein [Ktedonobacteraceae bacterium]